MLASTNRYPGYRFPKDVITYAVWLLDDAPGQPRQQLEGCHVFHETVRPLERADVDQGHVVAEVPST